MVITDPDKRQTLGDIYRKGWAIYRSTPSGSGRAALRNPERVETLRRIIDSADYLAEHIHEAPVLLMPCIYGRVDNAPVVAQSDQRFAVDSVASVDVFGGENVSNHPQIIIDVSGVVRISDHLQASIRPWLRLPRPNTPTSPVPDWSHELYQASIQYERPSNGNGLATRVEVGYNVSPIGLGIVDVRVVLAQHRHLSRKAARNAECE
jgi:hypothetical protein